MVDNGDSRIYSVIVTISRRSEARTFATDRLTADEAYALAKEYADAKLAHGYIEVPVSAGRMFVPAEAPGAVSTLIEVTSGRMAAIGG